jgi:hypothetical protein
MTGTLGRLALPATLSTSTWNSATAVNVIPVTGASGKIDNNFLATSTFGLQFATSSQVWSATTTSTWTKPTGAKFVVVTLIGGGGAGGGSSGSNSAAGGGGGAIGTFTFDAAFLSPTVTVTVGAGGAGVINAAGLNGATTTFGSYALAGGGGGGGTNDSGTKFGFSGHTQKFLSVNAAIVCNSFSVDICGVGGGVGGGGTTAQPGGGGGGAGGGTASDGTNGGAGPAGTSFSFLGAGGTPNGQASAPGINYGGGGSGSGNNTGQTGGGGAGGYAEVVTYF